ncbi:hypothetical protein PT7_P071 (plasmid) [Pusillimonas sp. T7-7]|uniref:hypothetical protein n=1 Tax=Pusillimonas sp. (strain T7-7) TaxID=1007105 RepID=UPI0002084BD4|nr:hypothetical protein [Pusillimonas sp. T7-7]AEC22307.1 hypothetical protein PT7_P071 [Pusillimonas sp. T7-7]
MAGEWLKFDASTPDKPEVLAITVAMGWDDPDLTVGKLLRMWRWFDQQTIDGNAAGVTPSLLDRLLGVSGLCAAMESVGWLEVYDGGIILPNFDRHNGKTAKNRALTAKRVAIHKTNADGNAKGNAPIVSAALPREEKRREEKNKEEKTKQKSPPAARAASLSVPDLVDMGVDAQVADEFLAIRKKKRSPLTPLALEGIRREAGRAGMTLGDALRKCVERGWQGFEAGWVKNEKPGASRHGNFASQDYRAGVGADGSF